MSTWGRITKETLTAIAAAIRAKTGKSALIEPVDMPAEIASIPQKELPPAPVQMNAHNFFDYDGTLLASYSAAEIAEMTELPTPAVSHDGLVFDGWNWTLAEVQAAPFSFVGACYKTDDNKNHFTLEITQPGFPVYISGGDSTDWGDGTTGGTSHVYTKAGRYVVKTSGDIGGASSTSDQRTTDYSLKEANYKTGYVVGASYGRYFRNVEIISWPGDCTLSAYNIQYVLQNVQRLKYMTIPRGWNGIPDNSLSSGAVTRFLSIPCTVQSVKYSALYDYNHGSWFVAPPAMTSIQRTGIVIYDSQRARVVMTAQTPPALGTTLALGEKKAVVVYVPDGLEETYGAATNYSGYTIRSISTLITELTGGGQS